MSLVLPFATSSFRRRGAALAGALAALLVPAAVVRAGGPQGPASVCNPAKGEAGKLAYTDTGAIENTSTTSEAIVVCPIDFTSNPDVLQPSAVQVATRARGSTPVKCTAWVFYEDGLPVMQGEEQMNPAGVFTFDFQILDLYLMGGEYFAVKCVLPPNTGNGRSQILSWQSGQNILF
jgi:hypothetical protein